MQTSTSAVHGLMTIAPGIWNFIRGKPFTFGINVANMCPIGCDCYWRIGGEEAKGKEIQMTEEQMVAFFHKMKSCGFIMVFMIGGEPYTRPILLEKLAGIIPFSLVVTSGTTPLRYLKDTVHHVSVDGADAETHNRVRKSSGLYERIVKNLTRARQSFSPFPVYIHIVLNRINYQQVGQILAVWAENGLADGVCVSTMTPIGGADRQLRLTTDQRYWIVETLHQLKKDYQGFLTNTALMIDMLRPDFTQHLTPERCKNAQYFRAYDAAGQRIQQCIFGPEADCAQCGCYVTTLAESFARPGGLISNLQAAIHWAKEPQVPLYTR
jgi:MoaA/NifB/PqqE/SkfB family radical SAM enzyme